MISIKTAFQMSLASLCMATVSSLVFLTGLSPIHADDPAAASDTKVQPAFVSLYNGKDLTGWTVKDGDAKAWKAEGELIVCSGDGGGWLRSDAMYSDFVLKLDYRIPAGGNSGVGLRFPLAGDPAHDGMEVQILDDAAPEYKDLVAAQYNGGIYYQAAAKTGSAKPAGEWNSYEIACKGPFVTVTLNGTVINDVDLTKFTTGAGDHTALADRPEVGFVGMQSHGNRVEFKNIQIQDLTKKTENGVQYYDIVEGTGEVVQPAARVECHYTGRFMSGKMFDSSRTRDMTATFPLTRVIKGWGEGIPGMKVGGRRKLVIPSDLAYGPAGKGEVIPPNSPLVFDVEVFRTFAP